MKTKFTLFIWLISCYAILFNLPANAQYPIKGAPLWGVPAGVNEGLLQPLDQKTKPIWFKVNGNIVGPQPHNKMHNPNNPLKGGSYVTPGALVDVNFNVNKNVANRYTIVSYTINTGTGERSVFDYQSNLFNQNSPVQGNSNQQLVLVPTNCPWEVYFVKGALVESFTASGTQDLTLGPLNNPYAYDAGALRADNRILGFTFGDGAQGGICELCPVVNNSANPQVFTRLLEVIDLPTNEMEMLFAVINLNGTTAPPYTANNKSFELIGDILFSGITPTHTKNNTPYGMRSDYQLSPILPNYQVGNPVVFGPKDAFVFDQRNNHNNLAFDTYQSEVVRFKVSDAEYARISSPTNPIAPEICVELSPKHPEPHKTLVPIYCGTFDFDCGPNECPTTGTSCDRADCAFSYFQGETILEQALGVYRPDILVTNTTDQSVLSVTFQLPLLTADEIDELAPAFQAFDPNVDFTITTPSDATNTYIIFTQIGDNWDIDTTDPLNPLPETVSFTFSAPQTAIDGVSGALPMTIQTLAGNFSQTFNLLDEECGLIPLPVELISFTGASSNLGIALKWETASEKNNDRFEVERSADGRNFEKIGTVKGNGTTSTTIDYSLLDKRPLQGLNYYRLKQVDFNSAFEYSQIIKVNSEKGAVSLAVQLLPNPCADQNCSVLLKGIDTSKPVVVEMQDLTGRTVLSQKVASDQTSLRLPNANLGKGIYILSAKNGEHITYQKVIIQ